MKEEKKYLNEVLKEKGLEFKPDNIYDYEGLYECENFRYLCLLYANYLIGRRLTSSINSKEVEDMYDFMDDILLNTINKVISIGDSDFFEALLSNEYDSNIHNFHKMIKKSNKIYLNPEIIVRYYEGFYFLYSEDYRDSELVKLNRENHPFILILRDYFTDEYLNTNEISVNME